MILPWLAGFFKASDSEGRGKKCVGTLGPASGVRTGDRELSGRGAADTPFDASRKALPQRSSSGNPSRLGQGCESRSGPILRGGQAICLVLASESLPAVCAPLPCRHCGISGGVSDIPQAAFASLQRPGMSWRLRPLQIAQLMHEQNGLHILICQGIEPSVQNIDFASAARPCMDQAYAQTARLYPVPIHL